MSAVSRAPFGVTADKFTTGFSYNSKSLSARKAEDTMVQCFYFGLSSTYDFFPGPSGRKFNVPKYTTIFTLFFRCSQPTIFSQSIRISTYEWKKIVGAHLLKKTLLILDPGLQGTGSAFRRKLWICHGSGVTLMFEKMSNFF